MNIVIITKGFPVDDFEPYLDNEICFLANKFKKVNIIHRSQERSPYLELPNNVFIYNYKKKSQNYLRLAVNFNFLLFINEIIFLVRNKKFSILTFKIALKYLIDATHFSFFLNSFRDDCLYYNYWTDFTTLGCLIKNKKTISRFHGYDLYEERHPQSYLPFRKEIFKRLNSSSFISLNGLKYAEKRYEILNPVINRLGHLSKNQFKPKYELNNSLVLLSCSSIIQLKRIDKIIDALASINNIEIVWYHIGNGRLFEETFSYANKMLKKKNINFHFLNKISNKEVLFFYEKKEIDLFVNFSETEGIPYTFMEAFSNSVPVIAPNVGGINEILSNSNGFLMPTISNPNHLKDCFNDYMLMSLEQINKMRELAYKTWKEKYNSEKNYTAFVEDIASL